MEYFLSFREEEKLLREVCRRFPSYGLHSFDDGGLRYKRIVPHEVEKILWGGIRGIEPIKSFFFLTRERVSTYPQDKGEKGRAKVLLGVKGCDIRALEILDTVFIGEDIEDPFYISRRKNFILITSDCTEIGESCFCNLIGGRPYPEKGFDLNISPLKEGYVLEVGSEKGKELLKEISPDLKECPPEQIEERNRNREEVLKELEDSNKNFRILKPYEEIHREGFASKVWEEESDPCVGCGGCTSICPTCYCFLLYDQPSGGKGFERMRIWDYCQYTGFARVAGGANPRRRLRERFRHRYLHKLDYFQDRYGFYACTGCGRCIDVCMGKIDMRKVIKSLEESLELKTGQGIR